MVDELPQRPKTIVPQQLTARLIDTVVLNEKFTMLRFELIQPHNFSFISGQYLSIKVNERGERRSYSITSTPDNAHGFELLADVTPQGLGSQFLQQLKIGDTVSCLGPLGRFTLDTSGAEKALQFIATGSGIAPFYSMLFDLLQNQHDARKITLYWGLRYATDLCLQDNLQELAQAFPNFHFHPVLSQAVQEWPLCRGRVMDCLSVHERPEQAGYYLCGNHQMVIDMQSLLQSWGIEPSRIHSEKFSSSAPAKQP